VTLPDGLGGEEERLVVGGLQDAVSLSLVDSVLVLGRHAEKAGINFSAGSVVLSPL
jgi:hypothetical protein